MYNMRIVRNILHYFRKLMYLSVLIILGCDSRLFNNDKLIYSSLDDLNISFNFNEMYYSIGHGLGDINDCSSDEIPKCLTFDSTIILIPKLEIFDMLEDGIYEGRIETLDLEYIIRERDISVLGKNYKGYWFYVAHSDEVFSRKAMPEKLKGAYFYSKKHGILLYEHNSLIFYNSDMGSRSSEIYWSNSECGLFSDKCKLN